MTAGASQGDRERYLAAGMDGMISKPFDRQQLFDIIEKSLSDAPSVEQQDSVEEPEPTDQPILDLSDLLERLGGDREIASEILDVACEEFEPMLAALREAHARSDFERLGAASHALKSAAGNIGGKRAHDAAAELERCCRAGAQSSVDPAFTSVENEAACLQQALADWSAAPGDPQASDDTDQAA